MKNIIYIADPEILEISILECNEPLIDLKEQGQLRYGQPPENPLTESCYTKLRKTVFEKLCRAQNDLPAGWYFRLYEGFRSMEVQKILFEQVYNKLYKSFPNKNYAELFHESTRVISPIENLDGSMNIPPHNTGGAIDIEVIDANEQLIDMGMDLKDWNDVDPDLCLTEYPHLNAEASLNRKILLDVMTKHDFVNYANEWWHFSYGDRYWAYHKKQKHAMYGSADNLGLA